MKRASWISYALQQAILDPPVEAHCGVEHLARRIVAADEGTQFRFVDCMIQQLL
jgi:hypothetical protein